MGIQDWASREIGLDDIWTPKQFDSAVLWFGRYIETKLSERDKQGKPVYTLKFLLSDKQTQEDMVLDEMMETWGVIEK